MLGDNGAGKSTLIKIIAGLHQHTHGTYEVEGEDVHFDSPREALDRGIATVYQDLAVVPLMPVWRNFFLGNEVRKGPAMDIAGMRSTAKQELLDMGIDLRDVDQPIGTLSGGERQCVAIARAVHFGAKVLILDEPTAALGVKQSGVVLRYIIQAKERGLGVIFITHNPHHAYPVGDNFLILKRGRSLGYWQKDEITMGELTGLMAGGSELEELTHELEAAGAEDSELAQVAHAFEQEVAELHVGGRAGRASEHRHRQDPPPAMKIALDPYMLRTTPLAELPGVVAELGYEHIELSPREDFIPFFVHPRADRATIASFKKALAAPASRSPRCCRCTSGRGRTRTSARRPSATGSGPSRSPSTSTVRVMNSEFNGRPEAAAASEAQFWRSLEELLPVFEREGMQLRLEPHPDDFIEDGRAAVDMIHGIDNDLVTFLYCAPHTFHQGGDLEGIMRYAGPLLTHLHIADSFDHTGSSGLRYILNPPGTPARIHQHLDVGQGEVDWDLFFATLADLGLRRHRHRLRVRLGGAGRRLLPPQPRAGQALRGQAPQAVGRDAMSRAGAYERSVDGGLRQ